MTYTSLFPVEGADSTWFQRQLLEASPLATTLLTPEVFNPAILYVNTAFESLTGFSQDQVLGQPLNALHHLTPDQPGLLSFHKALQTQTACVTILHHSRPDETTFWVEAHLFPLRDQQGQLTHWILRERDITEELKYLQQLEESEFRYRTLFDETTDAVLMADVQGQMLDVNPAACTLFGHERKELMRMQRSNLLLVEDEANDNRIWHEALAGQLIPMFERDYVHKNGARGTVEVNLRLIKNPQNQPLFLQAVLHDITTRKAREVQLQLQSSALEVAANAIVIVDLEQKIEWCNEAYTMMTGYSRSELYGQRRVDLTRPGINSSTHYDEVVKTGFSDRPWRGQLVHQHKDGTLYTVAKTITPVKDDRGQVYRFIGILEDISENLAMEQALRESAERNQSLIMSLREGVFMQSADGTIEVSNPAANRLLGLSNSQVVGRAAIDPGWWALREDGTRFSAQDHPAIMTLRTGQPVSNVIMGVHKPDDSLTWISINTQPIFLTESPLPSAVVSSFSDITAAKQALALAFDTALERERAQLLTTFVQDAAHEFRTPLAIISSSMYIMSQSEDLKKRESYAERVEGQVRRMVKLVDNLLMMVKLKSGVISPRLAIQIDPLLRNAQAGLHAKYPDGAMIVYETTPGTLIQGYAAELREAFQQLLENALRYTPSHGQIIVRVQQEETAVLIEIGDTGIGIRPEALPHIFTTFWRDDESHTTPGFGVGLAIVKAVIEMHGGAIEVRSKVGEGSLFQVRLPLSPDISAPINTP